MNIYLVVLISLGAGLCFQRVPGLSERLTPIINNFAVYIAVPAIILAKVPTLDITPDSLFIVGAAWGTAALSLMLIYMLSAWLKWSKEATIVCAILAGLGNTGFLGLALIKVLANDQVVGYAVIYHQLGSFLIMSLVLPVLPMIQASISASDSRAQISLATLVKRVLLFPASVCLVIALLLPIEPLTKHLHLPLEWLGLTLLPCAMLVVGMQLHLRVEKQHWLPVASVLSIKMLLMPAIVAAAGLILSVEQDVFRSSVMQSAMASMVTPSIFLIGLNFAPRLTAAILGISTLLSFLTVPTLAFLLH